MSRIYEAEGGGGGFNLESKKELVSLEQVR